MEMNVTEKLDAKIDAGAIDNNKLVEIQLPLNMPYINESDYEPAYGHIEVNGKHYNFVKRKIIGNTLFLLCLCNDLKTTLVQTSKILAGCDYSKNSSSPKNQKTLKMAGLAFFEKHSVCPVPEPNFLIGRLLNREEITFSTADFSKTPEQPPEQFSI
jgi:hypothetical protein